MIIDIQGHQIGTYRAARLGDIEVGEAPLLAEGAASLGSPADVFSLEVSTGAFGSERVYAIRTHDGAPVASGLVPDRGTFGSAALGERHVLFRPVSGTGYLVRLQGLPLAPERISLGLPETEPTARPSLPGRSICLAEGTRVAAALGRAAVETLNPGDTVWTLDRGMQPVLDVRRSSVRFGAANGHLRPITVAAGALGRGCPSVDLTLSPQHRVLLTGWRAELFYGVEEVLVPVQSLLSTPGIARDDGCTEVTYVTLTFAHRAILEVGGIMAEARFFGALTRGNLGAEQRAEILDEVPGGRGLRGGNIGVEPIC
ncbi:hypothetical protein DXV76_08900 [Rhodobacteraceae bacterium CCMM004]|nr:hypothetical protein DXV76_08900 [Rhodobacteraceae bacterium CCMM004]